MKKFILYSFRTDNEGGYRICKSDDFAPELDYKPQSGWIARKSIKVADFNTIEELATILQMEEKESNDMYLKKKAENTNSRVVFGDVIYHDFNYHHSNANSMMDDFLIMSDNEAKW